MGVRNRHNKEIADAVDAYRRALREEDWDAVRARTDFEGAAEEEVEHPLLSRADERSRTRLTGVVERFTESSLRRDLPKLARFWRDASARVTAVRWVSDDEAEAYESVTAEGEQYETVVHLVHDDSGWRLRSVGPAPDRRARILLPTERRPALEPNGFRNRYLDAWGEDASMTVRDDDFVVETAQGVVEGRVAEDVKTVGRWSGIEPRMEPILEAQVASIELAITLSDNFDQRLDELATLSLVAQSVAETRADLVMLVNTRKVMWRAEFLQKIEAGLGSFPAIVDLWLNVLQDDAYVYTQGLGLFGLRELELAPRSGDSRPARGVLENLAAYYAEVAPNWSPGDTINFDDQPAYHVEEGRRGPANGQTYGRSGSLRLVPITKN